MVSLEDRNLHSAYSRQEVFLRRKTLLFKKLLFSNFSQKFGCLSWPGTTPPCLGIFQINQMLHDSKWELDRISGGVRKAAMDFADAQHLSVMSQSLGQQTA